MWQDFRYALRLLRNAPGFTAVAVLSLALGIGANTAIFSLANAVLLRPLPVKEPDRLVTLSASERAGAGSLSFSYPDYVDFRDHNEVFSGLIAYGTMSVSLAGGGESELVPAMIVSGNYFEVLGVKPALGRSFLPEEDRTPGTHPVVMLGYGLWQRRFGADPNIAGKTVTVNGRDFAVIGVTPFGFRGSEQALAGPDIWAPMMMQGVVRPPSAGALRQALGTDLLTRRSAGWLNVVGRLKPGVSLEQAQAAMTMLARQFEQARSGTDRGTQIKLLPAGKGSPEVRGFALSATALLMTVVALVLLIACANVANLLLARAAERRREISIRLALGASPARVLRLLLAESLLLAFLGGALGLLLAMCSTDLLVSLKPAMLSFFAPDVRADQRVLGFALLVSMLTGVLFGLVPAMQASKTSFVEAMRGSDALSRRLGPSRWLVASQVALSLVLLIGSGLFLRSLIAAQAIDPGFRSENVLLMSVNLNLHGYSEERGRQFYRQLLDRIEAIPGVRSATIARIVPLGFASRQTRVFIEGRPLAPEERPPAVDVNVVGPNYVQTMGIPLLRGRDLTARDAEGAPPVVIINETMARTLFAGEDPLGKRISTTGSGGPYREIVGVTKAGKYRSLGEEPRPFLYLPVFQNHEWVMTLHVRTAAAPKGILAAIRREVQALDRNLPVFDVTTLAENTSLSLYPARLGAALLGVFGVLALVLASVGMYGVMAYSVSRRTREIGVRMALGAGYGDVLRMIVHEGIALVWAGMAVGLLAALAVTRLLSRFLYGIAPADPATFVLISLLLFVVALVAAFIPARRAARVDPMAALRHE